MSVSYILGFAALFGRQGEDVVKEGSGGTLHNSRGNALLVVILWKLK